MNLSNGDLWGGVLKSCFIFEKKKIYFWESGSGQEHSAHSCRFAYQCFHVCCFHLTSQMPKWEEHKQNKEKKLSESLFSTLCDCTHLMQRKTAVSIKTELNIQILLHQT